MVQRRLAGKSVESLGRPRVGRPPVVQLRVVQLRVVRLGVVHQRKDSARTRR